jgi:hypothetical protein
MWTRDERSAHFSAVPARHDAKPNRFFHLDVTRRENLHEFYCFQIGAVSYRSAEISDRPKTTTSSALVGEPGKISKDSRDQIAMMGISRS